MTSNTTHWTQEPHHHAENRPALTPVQTRPTTVQWTPGIRPVQPPPPRGAGRWTRKTCTQMAEVALTPSTCRNDARCAVIALSSGQDPHQRAADRATLGRRDQRSGDG